MHIVVQSLVVLTACILAGQNKGVEFAGARSSAYGIRPFPSPGGWSSALKALAGHFPDSTPTGIWIAGRLNGRTTGINMEFPHPNDRVGYGPLITFAEEDKHEPFLKQLDEAGIKVFLQAEPGFANVGACIDLMLRRYKHHSSVIGGASMSSGSRTRRPAP